MLWLIQKHLVLQVNGNDVRTASHRHVVSLIRKTGHNLILKVISVDKKGNATNEKPPGITRSNSLPSGMAPVVNGTSSHDGPNKEKKPPPIPSRAPTTSLSMRPKTERHSISGKSCDWCPMGNSTFKQRYLT